MEPLIDTRRLAARVHIALDVPVALYICLGSRHVASSVMHLIISPRVNNIATNIPHFQSRDSGYFTFRDVDRRRVALVLQKSLQV